MQTVLGIGVDALAYGMVLFVITIGLSLTMGLMRLVNLAHGAFAMIGGYIASWATQQAGLHFSIAVMAAMLGTMLIAMPLERVLYRRIYGRPAMEQVLMTIGITFVIIGVANYLMGPSLKTIPLPASLTGPVDLGFRAIPAHKLMAMAVGGLVALALWLLMARTVFGIRLRAAVDDAGMAGSLGIRTDRVYAAAFALATGLSALGGVIGAQMLPIEPYYALRYMVTFLVVVAVGGAGSIPGALIACLLLGAVETTGRYLLPQYGETFFYLAVVVIVCLFPNGLRGRTP